MNKFVAVPTRLYNELQCLKDTVGSEYTLDATYQMGLCRIPGFGVSKDYQAAFDLVMEAAKGNHHQAKAVVLSMATALGINLSRELQDNVKRYRSEAFMAGIRTAVWDRGDSTLESYEHVQSKYSFPKPPDAKSLGTFEIYNSTLPEDVLLHIKKGHLINSISSVLAPEAVNFVGPNGDTPLHWATLIPGMQGVNLVQLLLDAGARVESSTSRDCPISESLNGFDTMPINTTPLEWATITDNIEAFGVIEEFMRHNHTSAVSNSTHTRSTSLLSYAVQYQSLRCLEHLRQNGEHTVNSFDSRGFSPFYYAVRPDIFGRVLRYDCSMSSPNVETAPFLAREIEVIEKLRDAGSDFELHCEILFTCLHMTAGQGEPEILQHLLQEGGKDSINKAYGDGWTPLKDAITRGDSEAFSLLLEHGADTEAVWKGHHALHLCCMFPGSQAVHMATRLINANPSAIQSKNKKSQTPLHLASHYGHLRLIELFLSRGARLLGDLSERIRTPLGYAIRSRHVLAVALLSLEHREQNVALTGATGVWTIRHILDMRAVRFIPGKYISALEYLLTPGLDSPSANFKHANVPRQLETTIIGCCDVPFSRASLQIVDVLIENYKLRIELGKNLYLYFTYPVYRYESGLRWAVRLSNVEAVTNILSAGKNGMPVFDVDLRDLIELACSQLLHGMSHFATPIKRRRLVDLLRERQIDEFRLIQRRRTDPKFFPLLRWWWTIYYKIYASIEQAQYERAITWQLNTRPRIDPKFLEFRSWRNPRVSIYAIIYLFLWALLLPTIISYALVSQDPSSHISSSNMACTVIVVFLVSHSEEVSKVGAANEISQINGLSLWPRVFRITCIFFDRARIEFPGDQWAIGWVQFALCLLVIGIGILEMWLLDPQNTNLIRFGDEYQSDAHWSGLDLEPGKRHSLSRFHSLCETLMAWIVFFQM